MNNRELAQQIAAKHGNDAYSVALAILEEQNKIKAEAVREAFESAKIPTRSKAGCIGEFAVHVKNGSVCPECYGHEDDPECEICHGESIDGLSDLSVDIPWMTQKEIFKAFCKYAAQDAYEYANQLESQDD